MNVENRWIITTILLGAVLGMVLVGVDVYFDGDATLSYVVVFALFLFALITGPSYEEYEHDLRQRYRE